MKAKEHGRRVGRNEPADQIGERVVIVRGQRERSLELMIPGLVVLREERRLGVENVAMQDVGQNLASRKQVSKQELFQVQATDAVIVGNPRTSRPSSPRARSLNISQGIGSFIDTFTALRMASPRTKSDSIAACAAIPMPILSNAHPATLSSFTRIRPRFLPPGKPDSPCALTTTDADGVRMSKRKNRRDGKA